MDERPSGTVTFLFTDIEGSTRRWENDPTGMAAALEVHDRVIRSAIESSDGFVFATGGDSFSAAFSSPTAALSAAVEAQRGLVDSGCGLRVRMGLHSGEAVERDGNYFGPPLNRTARLMAVGHGGQVLVSGIGGDLVSASGFVFIDLGEHRLADLAAPVRISQLVADGLDTEFPPLMSAVANNLPLLGEVFGRGSDVDQLAVMLADRRLVTLTGAGGIGKSTLATYLASVVFEPFPDGRWLVDLTDLPPDSDQTAIAAAVSRVDERFTTIEALAPRQMLLIMDNCEHVIDATGRYLAELLAATSNVTVIATSREPLSLAGEMVVPVEPLSVAEGPHQAPAIALFVERATDAGVALDLETDQDTIAAICRELEGLPLAIELAAARTAVMTPTQVLGRLADQLSILGGGHTGPKHHRTIEATVAWSYDYLDADSQQLLRFLSVFLGGFDLDEAEAMGGDGTLDHLADLVAKSMVQRRGGRLAILEAVRQFAAARLQEADEECEARKRHCEFFAAWAHEVYHRADRITLTDTERQWITDNLANMRMAVRFGARHGHFVEAAELAVVLFPHQMEVLYGRSDFEDWFEPLLDHLDRLDPQLRMGVLHGSGTIALEAGEWEHAQRFLRAELEIHHDTGILGGVAQNASAHNNLAIIAGAQEHWDEAERLFREGIEEHKKCQAPHHILSSALSQIVCFVRNDPVEALAIVRDSRPHDHLAVPWEVALAGVSEAEILIEIGDFVQARTLLLKSLKFFREHRLRFDKQAQALQMLSHIAHQTGDLPLASTLLLEAVDIRSSETLTPIWHTWERQGAIHLAQVLLDLDAPSTAARVLDECQAVEHPAIDPTTPVHRRRLQELQTRCEHLDTEPTGDGDTPLADAVRQALTSHQAT